MEEDLNTKLKEEVIEIANNLKVELGKIKKKNQKLEEGYIKLNSDLKNLKSDRKNLENFLKIIFINHDNQENYLQTEFGLYDSDELKKIWMITETTKEAEFQKILSISKEDKNDLSDTIKTLETQLSEKNSELNIIRKTLEENITQLNFYTNNFKTTQKKNLELEQEKSYLMKIIDEKTNEIDKLQHIELELAELKAQQLLFNDEDRDEGDGGFGNFNFGGGSFKKDNQNSDLIGKEVIDKKKNLVFSGKEELKIGRKFLINFFRVFKFRNTDI